jgi:DMSO/TMAO reductase YedYZ molybdopterin-dependent catalytic subunit
MECAENPVGGGLVSHAEWTGFTLLGGRTHTQPAGAGSPAGRRFPRCIPIEKALHADTLIAYSMNGEKLRQTTASRCAP